MKYDFSGWATRNDILCTDGRTIRKDAFKECDGKTVPLVWNHQHNDPDNVLGHALLKNMDEGVLAYCSFNDTSKAQNAKMAVEHGDVDSLSIFANRLKQEGGNVLHGDIKEVSLVLAGANSGAHIIDVIRHGEISDDEFILFPCEELSFEHSDDEANDLEAAKPEAQHAEKDDKNDKNDGGKEEAKKSVQDVLDTFTKEQKTALCFVIGDILEDEDGSDTEDPGEASHADSEDDKTVGDILETLNEEQKDIAIALIAQAVKEKESKAAKHTDDLSGESSAEADTTDKDSEKEIKHNSENTEGGTEMHDNIFERNAEKTEDTKFLSHADQVEILNDAKKNGTLKDAILAHGITDIEVAYPDPKTTSDRPEFIMRKQDWVTKVMNGVHHTPFSRIRSLFADITADEARAKGYADTRKGQQKAEEVIGLLKRETEPTTVYKVQKLDRDDVVDITDFDVVAWLREEMEVMLDEERARAYLVGDGRSVSDPHKIKEDKIRPIWTMESLFAINATFNVAADATDDDIANGVIRASVKGFDDYDGSGSPVMFVAPDRLSTMLLLEDKVGHRLYKTKADLAAAMLVDEIIPVPVMKNLTRTVSDETRVLDGIIVDLRDYNVGATRGGRKNWFDDFNIDFNKLEYMIEARESGTLVKPKSAIIVEHTLGN